MVSKEQMSKICKSNVSRGKTLERRVAKLFTEWTGETFRRRRVEGRDQTTIERDSPADIISVSKNIIFSIEVKNAKGFSIDSLLANPKICKLTAWWHQATYDANIMTKILDYNMYPFLFFKPIPSWDWVMFPTGIIAYNWFPTLEFDYSKVGTINMDVSQSKKNSKMVELILPNAIICRWQDFITNIKPESIFV